MGASQPGRKCGGYSAGYNWSHEAAVMGAYAKSQELRAAYAKTLEQMRKEQAVDPDDLDRCPGIDAEIDQRLAKNKDGAKSLLRLVENGEYRTMGGFKAVFKLDPRGSLWAVAAYDHRPQTYEIKQDGSLLHRAGAWLAAPPSPPDSDLDLIGPWNPRLEGIDPPPGYQFTGEFRVPLDGEIMAHIAADGLPTRSGLSGTKSERRNILDWAKRFANGNCWILVPRPAPGQAPTNPVAQAARPKRHTSKGKKKN